MFHALLRWLTSQAAQLLWNMVFRSFNNNLFCFKSSIGKVMPVERIHLFRNKFWGKKLLVSLGARTYNL